MIDSSERATDRKGPGVRIKDEDAVASAAKSGGAAVAASRKGRRRKAPSCQSCFFGCRGLCALELGRPCATYRPDGPEGLAPPRQPELLLREADENALAA
jgi:hypothetical protein